MPVITINLTEFEIRVLEHRYIDFAAYLKHRTKFTEVGTYVLHLAEKIMARSVEESNREPLPDDMSIEEIVNTLFNEQGYLNAAERASRGIPNKDRIV